MEFIHGESRKQVILLPDCLGDYVTVVLDRSGKVVTDSVNRGTFNFALGIAHFDLDMAPYYKWGNDPIDRLTTKILNRVTGIYGGPTPKGIFK
jgi:hypothetical protein